ncbi:MAG: helix-turn-helix domain-containing protein [Kofleriaceae bacterium]
MNASNENNIVLASDGIGELVDEASLAKRLNVSRSTLQSWRYTGRGPRWIKLGRLIRYRVRDIDDYLEAHTRGNVA